jgi:AcrR family transcriptional regulator
MPGKAGGSRQGLGQNLIGNSAMPIVPTTKKGQKTRQHLLAAARRVIKRDGFVALRMGDVAAEAKISLGGLYRYFENKDDLFLSLIGDIHKELYEASRARKHSLRADPFATLRESNEGYLVHYYANRDIMRAFIEATTVDKRVCEMWWWMRQRHIDRFVTALKRDFNITEVGGISTRVITEALASAVEQSAYVWYARESLNAAHVPVKTAAEVLARIWYRAIWSAGEPEVAAKKRAMNSKQHGRSQQTKRDEIST